MSSLSANMSLKLFVFTLHFLVCRSVAALISVKACATKNISCSEVKNSDGHYHFHFETPDGTTEIEINQNGTALCQGSIGNLEISSDIKSCDNKSIIMQTCNNFALKFIIQKNGKTSESCVDFIITADEKTGTTIPLGLGIFFWVLGVAFVVLVIVVAGCCIWNKLWKKKGCGLPVWCRHRKGIFSTERTVDEENRQNCVQENLLAQSDRPESNGGTMEDSINMDDMTTTNDDECAPQVNGALLHEGQNGNMWHDPGGGNADTGLHGNGHLLNGGTLGGQSSDRDQDKRQRLTCSQRCARSGFDEAAGGGGGRQALVHSLGPGGDDTTPPDEQGKGVTSGQHLDNDI